jgi:hypothetical protein
LEFRQSKAAASARPDGTPAATQDASGNTAVTEADVLGAKPTTKSNKSACKAGARWHSRMRKGGGYNSDHNDVLCVSE